jgi:hypothetical protein
MKKPIGFYVTNAKGEQLAWAHTRATARQLFEKLARTRPELGPFWIKAEYA